MSAPGPRSPAWAPASTGVLIVGAGVVGAAIACHLARLGVDGVTVFDRGVAGGGMSSRSSALIRMHYTFPPEIDLALRSDAMFRTWPELTGRPPFVRRTGFVRIVHPEDEQALRANVALARQRGADMEVIGPGALRDVAPGLHTADLGAAAWEEQGGYGDGAVAAGDLLAAARERGVRYLPRTPVRALLRAGDRVTGVEIPGGAVRAGTVIVAAGVWAAPLAATAGVTLPIETEYHEVAVLAHNRGAGAPVACIDSVTQTYFRPDGGGSRTLVGTFTGPRGVDPDHVRGDAPLADLAGIVAAAARRVPALAQAGAVRGVTGVYDITPDARPLLGEFPGVAGLVIAAGFSGMGFKIAPAAGEAIAELVAFGKARQVDIEPFRPARFAERQPIRSPFPYADD